MITEEQVKLAMKTFDIAMDGRDDGQSQNELNCMRKALEAYEASKWVKFDEYDESTYPPFDVRVLTKLKGGDFGFDMSIDFMTHSFEWYNSIRLSYVTHWQLLPEFKE